MTAIIIAIIFISFHSSKACTVFNAYKGGLALVGRNFDWDEYGGNIWFLPASGTKHGIVIFEQIRKSMPFEEMNDQGLFVGMAAVPNTKTPFYFFKPAVTSLTLMKMRRRGQRRRGHT